MERKPYSAGAVKFSFWFMEFRKTVQLLSEGNQHFMWGAMPLSAPGSNQQVSTDNSRDCLGKVLRYIAG